MSSTFVANKAILSGKTNSFVLPVIHCSSRNAALPTGLDSISEISCRDSFSSSTSSELSFYCGKSNMNAQKSRSGWGSFESRRAYASLTSLASTNKNNDQDDDDAGMDIDTPLPVDKKEEYEDEAGDDAWGFFVE